VGLAVRGALRQNRDMSAYEAEARWHGTRVRLVAGDITSVSVDAVVNAANSALAGGGGVDGAIHAAAGPSVMAELERRYEGCPTGSAVITDAGNLPARHIIHAVGPIWRGGSHDEAALLRDAYTASLDLVAEAGDRSVAFAAISCGVYGYPLDEAAEVALSSVRAWLSTHPHSGIEDISWVLRGPDVMAAFRGAPALTTPEP
jgi:O-acetyl-ADP-ribose deacetylase (regulator of RNase III)